MQQADLSEDSMPILDGVALVLNNRREIKKLTVEGHTCNAPSWVRCRFGATCSTSSFVTDPLGCVCAHCLALRGGSNV